MVGAAAGAEFDDLEVDERADMVIEEAELPEFLDGTLVLERALDPVDVSDTEMSHARSQSASDREDKCDVAVAVDVTVAVAVDIAVAVDVAVPVGGDVCGTSGASMMPAPAPAPARAWPSAMLQLPTVVAAPPSACAWAPEPAPPTSFALLHREAGC